jgi:gp6-like head-tail connector protein
MAASDLTTLADVKAWLNTTGTFGTTDDALLTRLITAASQFLKNWLSRDIVLTNYTELRDGVGSQSFSFAIAAE